MVVAKAVVVAKVMVVAMAIVGYWDDGQWFAWSDPVLVHCMQAMGMEVGLLNSDKMKELASQINELVTKVRGKEYTLLLC